MRINNMEGTEQEFGEFRVLWQHSQGVGRDRVFWITDPGRGQDVSMPGDGQMESMERMGLRKIRLESIGVELRLCQLVDERLGLLDLFGRQWTGNSNVGRGSGVMDESQHITTHPYQVKEWGEPLPQGLDE